MTSDVDRFISVLWQRWIDLCNGVKLTGVITDSG